ncbi:MAG: hypothetical protein DMG58_32940 [Acidobacteria bacterium]|nr:MAG: hypothetical protein DMG58_32940 [Acidobacteriota bacterium]HTC77764.1 hypothetical protein [Terriglobales bacterium]
MISAVIERCAGMDVGKKFLAVCVMTGPAAENATAELRSSARFKRNWNADESGSKARAVGTW